MSFDHDPYDDFGPPRRKGAARRRIMMACGILLAAGLGTVAVVVRTAFAEANALKSGDLTKVREDALVMFPLGTHLDETVGKLVRIGFECLPVNHLLPDISAPSFVCSSNGRGWPNTPAYYITVTARNGLLSDLDVWNVMARSDREVDDISGYVKKSAPPSAKDGSARIGVGS